MPSKKDPQFQVRLPSHPPRPPRPSTVGPPSIRSPCLANMRTKVDLPSSLVFMCSMLPMPLRAALDGALLRGSGTSRLQSLQEFACPEAEVAGGIEVHALFGRHGRCGLIAAFGLQSTTAVDISHDSMIFSDQATRKQRMCLFGGLFPSKCETTP